MDRAKGDYVDEISAVFEDQVYQLVRSDQQGFSSTTYFVTFADKSSTVIQFRPSGRPLDNAALSTVRSQLGTLIPEIRLVKEVQNGLVLVYQMTRIPGDSFCVLSKSPEFIHLLPSIAANMGHLLGKCYIPGSRCGDDHAWLQLAQEQLRAAIDSDDSRVAVNQAHYRQILNILRSGALNDLPLSVSNDDISPTNIIVHKGISVGLVDWEDLCWLPLGWETRAVFWLMGSGRDEHYVLYDNAVQSADAFWNEFWAQLPCTVHAQSASIQSAMQIGAALSTVVNGRYNIAHFASLPVMLAYNIPALST